MQTSNTRVPETFLGRLWGQNYFHNNIKKLRILSTTLIFWSSIVNIASILACIKAKLPNDTGEPCNIYSIPLW